MEFQKPVGNSGPQAPEEKQRIFSWAKKTDLPRFLMEDRRRHMALSNQPGLPLVPASVWEPSYVSWKFRRQQATLAHRPLNTNAASFHSQTKLTTPVPDGRLQETLGTVKLARVASGVSLGLGTIQHMEEFQEPVGHSSQRPPKKTLGPFLWQKNLTCPGFLRADCRSHLALSNQTELPRVSAWVWEAYRVLRNFRSQPVTPAKGP